MNLIALLYNGEISVEEAERIFDETIQQIHKGELIPDWREILEMNNYEASAYLHGATFTDLVKLRYEGWPTVCCRCGLALDFRLYGWWFEHSEDGVPRLRHVTCPLIP